MLNDDTTKKLKPKYYDVSQIDYILYTKQMGYMHIDQLYKCAEFFRLYPKIYIMEKIHGTSTWIRFDSRDKTLRFHSGGAEGSEFAALFNEDNIMQELSNQPFNLVKIHGEAYGGKMQGMSDTYGPELKFVAFDVYVEDALGKRFLNLDEAECLCKQLGLEFVHYIIADNNPEIIESQSMVESTQAVRNGVGHEKQREGVVVKPIVESYLDSGRRAVFKHKNKIFWEITIARPLGEELKIVSDINAIIDDWVTDNRFSHVADRVLQTKLDDKNITISDIKVFIDFMIEDVQRESAGEVVWTTKLEKSIRKKTGSMFRSIYCIKS